MVLGEKSLYMRVPGFPTSSTLLFVTPDFTLIMERNLAMLEPYYISFSLPSAG